MYCRATHHSISAHRQGRRGCGHSDDVSVPGAECGTRRIGNVRVSVEQHDTTRRRAATHRKFRGADIQLSIHRAAARSKLAELTPSRLAFDQDGVQGRHGEKSEDTGLLLRCRDPVVPKGHLSGEHTRDKAATPSALNSTAKISRWPRSTK